MHVIDFNAKIDDKIQSVFVIIYSTDGKPWRGYKGSYEEMSDLTIPTCLMLNRWDGAIGFIGGKVEESMTFEETLKKEVKEEINDNFSLKFDPIVAHDIGPITTHAVASEVSYAKLLKIRKTATRSLNLESQITGIFMPHLVVYDDVSSKKKGGIVNLYKASMAPSVREELTHFLLKKKIFSKVHLKEIVRKAGFSLEELLK